MSSSVEVDALSRHLRELEESLLLPDVRKSKELVALLADEFVEFGSSGRIYNKGDLVAALQAEAPTAQITSSFTVGLAPGRTSHIRHPPRGHAACLHAAQLGVAAS